LNTTKILGSPNYTSLVITECPINCDTCQQIWKNKVFCIRIICECKKCNHKKNIVLDGLGISSNTYCSNQVLNLARDAD
jgi:hypothetical protein